MYDLHNLFFLFLFFLYSIKNIEEKNLNDQFPSLSNSDRKMSKVQNIEDKRK